MCWAEKCCFCVKINIGTTIIGIGSFIIFSILAVTSAVLLVLEDEEKKILKMSTNSTNPVQHVFGTDVRIISINVILVTVLIVSVLAVFFSVLLLIGIIKNRPGLVLSYFSFGIMATILMQLGCLLLLLSQYWYFSLIWFIVSLFYIHYLVVVHTVYELMQRGKLFGVTASEGLEEELLN
ncbi:unnamed protein product [Parnassius apollo]|uniref:(apollo) hypothetical protein n=1 Tax=Parnassius apollo TaxID=110799 RepID=A0A8S3Y2E9_PARAO|nr:unnamed protein product [Parnassius apollo]